MHALFERPHAHVSDRKHLWALIIEKKDGIRIFLRELYLKKSGYHDGIASRY